MRWLSAVCNLAFWVKFYGLRECTEFGNTDCNWAMQTVTAAMAAAVTATHPINAASALSLPLKADIVRFPSAVPPTVPLSSRGRTGMPPQGPCPRIPFSVCRRA